jgi:hypothetical protein
MDGVVGTTVRNNCIYAARNNSGIALFRIDGAVASRSNTIVHNTILMSSDGGWAVNVSDPGSTGNRVFHNITHSDHPWRGSVMVAVPGIAGFECDYNAVMDRFSIDGGGSRITLNEWRALGYDRHSVLAAAAELVADVEGDPHLATNSPAIDRGTNAFSAASDADGTPRPLDGDGDGDSRPDIGAYEHLNAWADSDNDGMTDGAELIAGTVPVEGGSVFRIDGANMAGGTGMVLRWPSVTGRVYGVDRATGLPAGFVPCASNVPARPPQNVHTVGVTSANTHFFRLNVRKSSESPGEPD